MVDSIKLLRSGPLRGEVIPPPDKSISHRALIFASIAKGKSIIRNLLRADDPLRTLDAMSSLGMEIRDSGETVEVYGKGLHGLREPEDVINCGNSGTTMRLLAGLLSGQPFFSVLTGDGSLRQRPMKRIIEPLRMMGAGLYGRTGDTLAPIAVKGGGLTGIHYKSPVASAQVKSAVLLAALYAEGETVVEEPRKSRDHTERMLPAIGAGLRVEGLRIIISGGNDLTPFEITVPGDFSSSAFFMVAAAIIKDSEIIIRNVGINPTRRGLFDIMKRMGADLEIIDRRIVSGEMVADILCRYAKRLVATEIVPEEVPAMIDEFPVFCVLASRADGTTTIRGAGELRVKESDRIAAMASELRKMGVNVTEYPDGLEISGPVDLRGTTLEAHNDHRVAMALSVAALVAEGCTTVQGVAAVDISFPGFYDRILELTG
ncbi:MAG TPA: 3-phosphoshikimate 1-carboxyvinyltransferase [Nitrospirae bacterium]|nr:3-phosphoshikimate 1-carboxyvinyltransferase [Nitrospirota bacterium]